MSNKQQCFYCDQKVEVAHNVCDRCSYQHRLDSAYRTLHHWRGLSPLFHDHEFTGLQPGAQITESCIKSLHGEVLFYSRFNPNIEVEKVAEKMTGLNLAKLEKEPQLSKKWKNLFHLINNRLLISWGSQLDERMLREAATYFDTPFGLETIFLDLEPLYSRIRGEWNKGTGSYARTSLKYAAELECITITNAHNAKDDVGILMAIYNKLLQVQLPKANQTARNADGSNEIINSPFAILSTIKNREMVN